MSEQLDIEINLDRKKHAKKARPNLRNNQRQIQTVVGFTRESTRKSSLIMLRQLVINMVGPWLIQLKQVTSMIVRPFLFFSPSQNPSPLNSLLRIQATKHLVLPSFFQKKRLRQYSLTLGQEVREAFYVLETLSMTSILTAIFVQRTRY